MQWYTGLPQWAKVYVQGGIMVFLLGAVCAVFAAAVLYVTDAQQKLLIVPSTSQISVAGEGKVSIKPDIATMTATVLTERSTVSAAEDENTAASNAVMRFLQQESVDAKDIKTVTYSIYPQYAYPQNKKPEITGYQVRNTMEIRIRDLSKVDEVLGGIVAHGANEIGNVAFTIEDPEAIKEAAREKAIANAKQKAETLSRDLGVRLRRIVGFSETGGSTVPPPIVYTEALGKGGAGGPALSQGEQEVTVSVTITYEFR